MKYSYDGITWNSTSSNFIPNTIVWNGVVWFAFGNGSDNHHYSNDGINWQVGNLINNGMNIFGAVWNGSIWIVVGFGYGITSMVWSNDGLNWINNKTANVTNNTTYSIAWNGKMFVAGLYGLPNPFMYSYDGFDWKLAPLEINHCIVYSIVWNGLLWVATSINDDNGAGIIFYSYDGINWNYANDQLFDQGTRGVAWNGSLFVAYGESTSGNKLIYSSDGINWSRSSNGDTFGFLSSLTWNGSLWISGKDEGVVTSIDGIYWNVNDTYGTINNIVSRHVLPYVGTTPIPNETNKNILEETSTTTNKTMINFMNNGLSGTNGKIASSATGMFLVSVFNNGNLYISNNYGLTWTMCDQVYSEDPPRLWSSVACSSDGFIIIATEYYGNVFTSINKGISWTQQISTLAYENTFVKCSTDGTMILIGSYGTASTLYIEDAGNTHLNSQTSISWMNPFTARTTPPLSCEPQGLFFTFQIPQAMPESTYLTAGMVSTSGTSYTVVIHTYNLICRNQDGDIGPEGENSVVVTDGDVVLIQTDGINNSISFYINSSPFQNCDFDNTVSYTGYINANESIPEDNATDINNIQFMKTGIINPPHSIVTQLIIDGSHNDFALNGLGITTNPISITLSGNIIYVAEYNVNSWISFNFGTTWTIVNSVGTPNQGPIDVYTSDGNTIYVLYQDDYIYVSTGISGSGEISYQALSNTPYSQDGQWSKIYVSKDGNTIYATETSSSSIGTIWYSIDKGITWKSLVYLNKWDSICASSDGKRIYAGHPTGVIGLVPDNTDIKLYNKNSTLRYTSYENMIVGTSNGSYVLSYSYDGINWYPSLNGNDLLISATCVNYNGNMWVASGSTNEFGNRVLYSYDGKMWYLGNIDSTVQINEIASNENIWIAACNSAHLMYSTDGFNWNGINISFLNPNSNLICVSWNGNMFVAGGADAAIIYSYDGVNWLGSNIVSPPDTSIQIISILWVGTIWVASLNYYFGINIYPLIYSYDGINWTFTNYLTSINGQNANIAYVSALGWNGEICLVSGYNNTINNYYLAYSHDGISWVKNKQEDQSYTFSKIIWNGNIWVGLKNNTILHSDDGIIWRNISNDVFNGMISIASRHKSPYKQTNGFINAINQIAKTIFIPPSYSDSVYLLDKTTTLILRPSNQFTPILNHVYMATMSFQITSSDTIANKLFPINIILQFHEYISKQTILLNVDTLGSSANLTLMFVYDSNFLLEIAAENNADPQTIQYTITNFSVYDMSGVYNNTLTIDF